MESYEAMRTALKSSAEFDRNNLLGMQNIAGSLDKIDARSQSDAADRALGGAS